MASDLTNDSEVNERLRTYIHHPRAKEKVFSLRFFLFTLFVHLVGWGALIFDFRWKWLLAATVFALFCDYAMGIFHHMYLTHRSFECRPWLRNLGVFFGTLTWRGPFAAPLRYVASHLIHHEYSDRDPDPHSPIHGYFHAFLGWFWRMPPVLMDRKLYLPYVPKDLRDDPFLNWLDKNVFTLQLYRSVVVIGVAGLWGASFAGFDTVTALRAFAYLVAVKTIIALYVANAVDVINHAWGYRNFETADRSRNSFFMAAVHLGGAISWHNNHHAHPDYFTVKTRPWEFDAHYRFLKFCEIFGWTWEIRKLDETHAH
ncbi:MAG TPA: fatty acid desaturase [Bdellovibrionota bacterium]|nr:fatty acid desaturase [Bdellovibrionota bacterium]